MKHAFRFACTFVAAALLSTPAFADPTDDVRAILQDFLDQPNYTWEVSSTRGKPEVANPGGEQETKGQHEMGGYTKMFFVSGPHILPRGTISRRSWEGFNDEQDFLSSRWVFATPDGWKLLSELPVPMPPGAPSRSTAPKHGVTIPILSGGVGFSMRWIGVWRPDQEIAIVIENLTDVEKTGPDAYRAELTPAGASKLVNPPRKALSLLSPSAGNASATIKLWSRRGALVRYELSVEATMMGNPISYSRTRDLTNFGITVIEVPDEVQHKLGK